MEKASTEKAANKIKVLVVDDDHSIVELLSLVLQDDGYEVVTAFNGREAIITALRENPNLIILDIMMPELDGWAVCEHLLSHEKTASTPIIFLTARVRSEDQLRGWYSGCFDYITKPFEVDQLLKQARSATESRPEEVARIREDLRRQKIAILQGDDEYVDEPGRLSEIRERPA